jgi:replicative DNA helicase
MAAYVKVVREKHLLRQLIRHGEKQTARAYEAQVPVLHQINESGAALFELGRAQSQGGFQHAAPHVDRRFEIIQERRANPATLIGLPTGFDFDELTGGLHKGEMTVLAARPRLGKTSLALQIAWNVATGGGAFGQIKRAPLPVAFVSLEMSKESLIDRSLAQIAGVNAQDMRGGGISDAEFARVDVARQIMRAAPLWIDDARGSTTFQLLARVRQMAAQAGGVGLIVVDYLQLARPEGRGSDTVRELSEVAKALRAMALHFECPLLALCQLSRAVESRDDKRPVINDLRGSGTIEEDADNIAFIYRPDVYLKNGDTTAEVIYGKQRNGPEGSRKLDFYGETMRFTNRSARGYGAVSDHYAPPNVVSTPRPEYAERWAYADD